MATGPWGRFVERLRSRDRWREIAYHVLALPRGVFTTVVAGVAWCGSAALVLLPLYVGCLPGGTAKFWVFEIGPGPTAFAATLVGLGGLIVVAPWVTLALARLDIATARWLLGPRRRDELGEQVRRVETRRAAAVDSAEAERRRIERDLHDGAQQRLVALAMDLGAARERLESDDAEGGARMVADAHEEAKAALKEIRDLVRGIHPVILEDRGLDAALSAVVARSPVPVTLDVAVAERPTSTVESAAYFVVTEALTNVARHAHATRANVAIARAGDRLIVEVRDDGVGGADPTRGTGLQGLRDRVDGPRRHHAPREPRRGTDDPPGGAAMRIVIAEDSVLLRAGLTGLLADAGHEVVSTVDNADELLTVVERHKPDLAVVDVRMPPTFTDDGLRAALQIRARWPEVGILVLSQYVEETYASELLANDTTGLGYLLKDRIADVSEFLDGVARVGTGGTALDPEVVAQLLARTRRRDPLDRLSPREREVLGLMAEGRTNAAIARELVVSDGAVEKHVSNIFTKLDLPPTEDDHRRVLAVLRWLGS